MLILGGAGFIGSNVVKALCSENRKVKVLNRGRNSLPFSTNLEYIEGSYLDEALLSKALDGVTTVVHVVSSTNPATSNLSPKDDVNSNLIGLISLLDLMRVKNIPKIIFISSGGTVYGDTSSTSIAVEHPLNPICSYGVVKVAMENYINMYSYLYGIKATILRVANPYGPGQLHGKGQGVIADFMHKIKSKQAIEIWGDGTSIRDYIYIDDLVSLCLKVIASELTGTFNVGSGVGSSIKQIIHSIENTVGVKAVINYIESRRFDVKSIVLDISETKKAFSWSANINLTEGVQKYNALLELNEPQVDIKE